MFKLKSKKGQHESFSENSDIEKAGQEFHVLLLQGREQKSSTEFFVFGGGKKALTQFMQDITLLMCIDLTP